jgi:hypothetical protein
MHLHDQIRIRHMLEAANDALTFATGRQRSDLDTDPQNMSLPVDVFAYMKTAKPPSINKII